MPFDPITPRPFSRDAIRTFAPVEAGVYGISNSREWIYIGECGNIQAALLEHLETLHTALMKRQPTGFVFEICRTGYGHARQDRLIQEYEPTCNRRSSSQL